MSVRERFSQKSNKSLPVWIAPALSLLLLGAIAAFFFWYWWGRSAGSAVSLSPDAIAAVSRTFAAPGIRPYAAMGNQGLLGRFASIFSGSGTSTRPAGAGPIIQSLRVLPHGSITQARAGGPIFITAEPYTLVATPNGSGRPGFHYELDVRPEAAFAPDDALVFRVANQMVNTKIGQEQSGAPRELITNLRTRFGAQLRAPALRVPDAQLQPVVRLWLQYVLASAATRQDAAIELLDAVAGLGPKALAANQQALTALVASVEQILPASQAAAYSLAIRAATRPAATQPAP